MAEGPPVCFLEGFPGTGKTTIADKLIERVTGDRSAAVKAIKITAPEIQSSKDLTDDLLLDLAMELTSAGKDELAGAIENNRPLVDVLSQIVKDPILIVIDEFQNTMRGKRAMTLGGFAKVLSALVRRNWLQGRILLLTNRLVERGKWSEPYAIQTLGGMENKDGVELLEHLAEKAGRLDEIPSERRSDVVKWLGGNPRAIRLLVSSLAYDSLDDLIGIKPERWELKEREVSAELLEDLERGLLEQTLGQLSEAHLRDLHRLAVHRKPFKKQAIELLFPNKKNMALFKREAIDRFLMELRGKWFHLHPILRQIGLQKLEKEDDFQPAHDIAAGYYTRHFEAKQIVGWGKLGGHFVEARYHLVKAGKADELQNIARPFQNYIFSQLSGVSPVPKDPEELDERIAVLSAFLEDPEMRKLDYHRSKGLHYHLARLFQTRNQRNDLGRGLYHAKIARSDTQKDPWLLCSDLLTQMERYEEAIALLEQGIKRVNDVNLYSLYVKFSKLLD